MSESEDDRSEPCWLLQVSAQRGSGEPQSLGERFNHQGQADLRLASERLQVPRGISAPAELEPSTAVDARLDPNCRAHSSTLPADVRSRVESLPGLATTAEAATLRESTKGPAVRKRLRPDGDEAGALPAGEPEAAEKVKPKKAKKPRRNEAAQLIEAALLSVEKQTRVDAGASTPLDLSLERRPKAAAPKKPLLAASPAKSKASGKSRSARAQPSSTAPLEGAQVDQVSGGEQAITLSTEPPESSEPQSPCTTTGLSDGLSMADRIKFRGARARASFTVTANGPLMKHTGDPTAKPPKPQTQQLQVAGFKPAHQALQSRFVPAPPKYANLNVLQKSGPPLAPGKGAASRSGAQAKRRGKGSKNSGTGAGHAQPVKPNKKARLALSPGSMLRKKAGGDGRAPSRSLSKATRKARSSQTPRTPRFTGNQCTRAQPLVKVAQKLKPAGAGPSVVVQPRLLLSPEVCGPAALEGAMRSKLQNRFGGGGLVDTATLFPEQKRDREVHMHGLGRNILGILNSGSTCCLAFAGVHLYVRWLILKLRSWINNP